MIKISGFEELGRELEDAQKALAELEGDLGSVNFIPDDPESIEAAIQSMEQIVDEKVGWKNALGKELQAAGHPIDWNKVRR